MIVYMVEDLFQQRRKDELLKKWSVIRPYYEKVYKTKIRPDLPEVDPKKVDELFKAMHRLNDEEFFHRKNKHK